MEEALEVDPNKDIVCKLCGAWFETRKGLSSHARAHLQPFGVEYSESKGSPIDLLHQATSSLLGPPPKRLKSFSMTYLGLGSSPLALPHNEPLKEIGCEFYGKYFENHKGLGSQARSHLRQMGITKGSVNSSPIDTLKEITRRGLPCALPLKLPSPSSPGPPRSPLPTSSSLSSSLLLPFALARPASPLQSKFSSTPLTSSSSGLNLKPEPPQMEVTVPGSVGRTSGFSGDALNCSFDSVFPLNLALEVDPNKDKDKLCGAWFETWKGLSSHSRAHLQPFGVEYSESKGSPIDLPHHQATSSLLSTPAKRLKSASMSFYGLSSGEFKALPHKKPLPSLIQSVETMASVIELLLETLKDLSDQDLQSFKMFLSQILSDKDYPDISLRWQMMSDRQDMVFYLVQDHCEHRLLEMTTEAFEKMNRTDLVQRLSQSSSGPKKKHSEAQRPAVIQKVATMAAVKHLLWGTLNDLSNDDFEKFKQTLDLIVSKKKPIYFSWILSSSAGRAQTVEQIMGFYGQQCVEITMEVLKDINRNDLRQRLTKPSSELKEMYSVDEHRPAQSEKASIAAVKEIVLETLNDLSNDKLQRFKALLQFTYFQKSISYIFHGYPHWTENALQLVDQMVETCGPQSAEVTREVLMDMDRTDLVERLSETTLRLKDKYPSKPLKEEVTVASLEKKLLETLEDLSDGELEKFKRGLQRISSQRLETAGRVEIVDLMVEIYGQQSMELTMEILKKMKEDDYGLEQKLSNITLGSKGPSRSLELEGSEEMMKDSSGWTKLEPEVNSTDEDEASTYSLKSEAGDFECSVSGLRWVCQEKVSFKYQFCSSEEPMKRMEMMKYMPAGPLIDITVISGKLFEVYLPHWICIDDIPEILQQFAVLHIDDCGDVVEKVSEVTSSHVKLCEPVFSPRAVLIKKGIPVKIHCNVLIYSKAYPSCTVLHVYLTPLDPALKETIDKKKKDFKFIEKPRPNEGLTLHKDFNLTADIKTEKICPEKITLTNDSQEKQHSIFFDVGFENPNSNFQLTLSQLNKGKRKPQFEPVWSCVMRKVELRNSGDSDVKETGGPPSITGPVDMENSSDEMPGVASITTTKERLLKMLKYLRQEEFKEFKWYLRDSDVLAGLPRISCSRLENSDILDLVDLMSQTYSQKYLEVTKKIFKEINRNDLVQQLSDIGSESKADG